MHIIPYKSDLINKIKYLIHEKNIQMKGKNQGESNKINLNREV